ncbi:hypothetical protein [Candidatus Magnetominusculus dajiuhuensis]|uniref:hypothetical protein n=1 Tax=Candidatus Magnetominusculus dajiuhuensis TaxID=3137712 RepID=UPI003B4324FF
MRSDGELSLPPLKSFGSITEIKKECMDAVNEAGFALYSIIVYDDPLLGVGAVLNDTRYLRQIDPITGMHQRIYFIPDELNYLTVEKENGLSHDERKALIGIMENGGDTLSNNNLTVKAVFELGDSVASPFIIYFLVVKDEELVRYYVCKLNGQVSRDNAYVELKSFLGNAAKALDKIYKEEGNELNSNQLWCRFGQELELYKIKGAITDVKEFIKKNWSGILGLLISLCK